MKIINIIIVIILLGGFSISCADEDKLTPSFADRNCFAVPEDNNDPESLLRKAFYESTHCYLLFNDTLRKERIGEDRWGNPLYLCELADPGYDLIMATAIKYMYSYIRSIEEQKAAVAFIQNNIFSAVTPALYPYSLLLTDTIRKCQYKTGMDQIQVIGFVDVVVGKRCMVISSMGKIMEMSEIEKTQLKSKILKELVSGKINALRSNAVLDPFYNISKNWYGVTSMSKIPTGTKKFQELGFLGAKMWYPNFSMINMYGKDQDLDSFVDALFVTSEEIFKQTNSDFPYVLQKYDLLKKIIEDMGFKF